MLPSYIAKSHPEACERKSLHKSIVIHLFPCPERVYIANVHTVTLLGLMTEFKTGFKLHHCGCSI